MSDVEQGPARAGDGVVVARPKVVLWNAAAWSVVLPGIMTLLWFRLPLEIRLLFTPFQVAEIAFIFLFMLGIIWVVGLSYVRADAAGVVFRNGLRTHRLAWSEVEEVRMTDHDPWAYVHVPTEVGRLPLLGIMRTDGARAVRLYHEVRALHARHGA